MFIVDVAIDVADVGLAAASSDGREDGLLGVACRCKILDQFYVHECSSSELGSGVVLAINDNDKDSVDVSKEFLNIVMDDDDKDSVDASKESLNDVMDELDNPLTDDQKLAFLEIAGNIKCGHLKMMRFEFDATENDLCTEYMSGDDRDDPDLCLAKENT